MLRLSTSRQRVALWEPPPRHILDVGGGRGDLALALAQRHPAALVTCVDRNAHSLAYGEAAAARLGLSNIRFVVADLSAAAGLRPDILSPLWCQPPAPAPVPAPVPATAGSAPAPAPAPAPVSAPASAPVPVDAVVALHACGGLTDAALALARAHDARLLAVPCCFLKSPELCPGGWNRTLCRLAESDRRDISLRAMRAINSQRLREHYPGGRSRLLAMDERLTARNLVLEAR